MESGCWEGVFGAVDGDVVLCWAFIGTSADIKCKMKLGIPRIYENSKLLLRQYLPPGYLKICGISRIQLDICSLSSTVLNDPTLAVMSIQQDYTQGVASPVSRTHGRVPEPGQG